MTKNYKKLYSYAIIMIVCVIMIVLVAVVSENRLETDREKYEETIFENKSQIGLLEKQIETLEKENSEMKKSLESNITAQSKLERQSQIMSDLAGIYKQIKEGKTEDAKKAFDKIDTAGFEDSMVAFYEIIKEMLNK